MTVSALALLFPAAAVSASGAESGGPVPVTFNDGWRWVYRGRIIDLLKEDIYNDPALAEEAFRGELGLTALGSETLLKEADALFGSLKSNGEDAKADVLENIILFYTGKNERAALEEALRLKPGTGYDALGWYLLGHSMEIKGFYPEALGYYRRVVEKTGRTGRGAARTNALFQIARISYFNGDYEEAKSLFEEAIKAGSRRARAWLADTLLIKGEFSHAGRLFEALNPFVSVAGLDPVTQMSMGDMAVINGDFERARSIFEGLKARYSGDRLLSNFFALKGADAFAAEGRRAEALDAYRKIKERLSMEEDWAMATLSIADIYAAGDSPEDLLNAYELYSSIANGSYLGSETAYIRMSRTAYRAGRFEQALKDARDFPSGYPSSRMKDEMEGLIGEIAVGWMNSLHEAHDDYSVVRLYADYGYSVPFGKKAAVYLIAGKSYAALGLDSDAVGLLDNAIKMGRPDVVEEAMITLADVYISQNDWLSAERLVIAFKTRFPESKYKARAGRVLLLAAFIKGDYRGAASFKVQDNDAEGLLTQARAHLKLEGFLPAIASFERALSALGGNGDKRAVSEAHAGIGDANFALKRYSNAVRAYRLSLDFSADDRQRSWALYRIARCWEKLGNDVEKKAALEELKSIKGEFSGWAERVFKQEARM